MTTKGKTGVEGLSAKDAFEALKKVQPKLLINNEWRQSKKGKKLGVEDPRTGEQVMEIECAGEKDVNAAVKAARNAFDKGPWPKMGPSKRCAIMTKLVNIMEERKTELALLEALDAGKPLTQAMNADLFNAIEHFRFFAGAAYHNNGLTLPCSTEHWAYTLHEPIGVVAAVTPWNFPLVEVSWKLGPALATGNTVVLKVSQHTSLSALLLGQMMIDAGFPPGVVNILTGEGKGVGEILVSHPDVDKVSFTGSTSVGRHIGELTGKHLKKCTLELGGKSPVIVNHDVDIKEAVEVVRFGLLFNAGQCCAAGTRIYIHAAIYDEFVKALVKSFEEWKVGDPFEPDTQQGPQISRSQVERIDGYVKKGQQEGAKLLTGGKRLSEKGYYYAPTLLEIPDPSLDHISVVQEEIFGPVACVFKWHDTNEVIKRANDNPYGLASGVICKDSTTVDRLVRAIKAGTVYVNSYNLYDAAVPFGGYKDSGIGREKSIYAMHEYTEVKAVYKPLVQPEWK